MPDRQLRELVIDLAGRHPEDVQAVLANLDAHKRDRVSDLLKEFVAAGFDMMPADTPSPEIDVTKLSPWLLERADGNSGRLTEETRACLRRCAFLLYPAPTPRPTGGFFWRSRGSSSRGAP